jgi:RNA polymerase sigma-70 factor (family 1)
MDKPYLLHLLQRISAQNDQRAFETLFKLFHQRLLRFSLHYVHNREQAEEIVSDVFVKLWNNRHTCTGIAHPETYLFIAVKNQSLNYVNQASGHSVSPVNEAELDTLIDAFDPEKELELRELQFDIDLAVESLPAQCKVVFKLIKEDGLKYKEVAQILNISVRTVETQLVRAMQKLDIALTPHISASKSGNTSVFTVGVLIATVVFHYLNK